MDKPNFAKIANDLKKSLAKHSPEILTGLGIAGMITTTILAVRATPDALRFLEDKKEELELEPTEKLPVVEAVKATWKCYIPAAVTGVASTACLIGAASVNNKRNAALAAAYALSDTTFREYREKVVEAIGEKKEQVVHDKVSEERIKCTPINNEVIVIDNDSTLFLEPISGRYFKSSIEKLKKAENALNKIINTDAFNSGVSLNDFYEMLGLAKTTMGETVGWNLDTGLIDIYMSPHQVEEEGPYEGQPCLVINYRKPPKYEF